jgi:protein-disulfide isomerase
MNKKLITVMMSAVFPACLLASVDAKTQEEIKKVLPNTKIVSVKQSPAKGWFSVFTGKNILYVSPKEKLIFMGHIFNRNGVDMTNMEAQSAIIDYQPKMLQDIKNLKAEKVLEIKQMSITNGAKTRYGLIAFTNPQCPHCRNAESFLLDKNIAIYFLTVGNPAEIALYHASEQPYEAYKNKKPTATVATMESNQKVEKIFKIAEDMGVEGTPTFFVVDETSNKIVDTILGANTAELQKWIDKNKEVAK